MFHGNVNFVIYFQVKEKCEQACTYLTDNSGNSRTGYSHFRNAEVAENKNRVEDNIYNCSYTLSNHGVESFSGSLQKSFKSELSEHRFVSGKIIPLRKFRTVQTLHN